VPLPSGGLICGRCVKSTVSAGERAGRLLVDLDLLLQSRSVSLPAHEFLEKSLPIRGRGAARLIEERHKIALQRAAPAGRHHGSPVPVFGRREARPIQYLRREVDLLPFRMTGWF
jgi:hypothetical protein